MKQLLAAALLTACLACGCARTVGPEEFLYVYRRGAAPTYTREGYKVRYRGMDELYHYLEVRHSTLGKGPGALLLYGPFREETLRCPAHRLPETFPDDFEVLYQWTLPGQERAPEPPSRTRKYIRNYLARHARAEPDGGQE